MKSKKNILYAKIFCLLAVVSATCPLYSQEKKQQIKENGKPLFKKINRKDIYSPKNSSRLIRLKYILEEGLRNNPDEIIRKLKKLLLDHDFTDARQKFWYPNISLNMSTSDQRIGRFRSDSSNNHDPGKIPSGTLGLVMGEYTVFNWGKDYADYLNERTDLKIDQRNLDEEKRKLRHIIISKYFELSLIKNIERINRNQLQHASFIYRLGREKASLKKITQQDYLQARSVYLRSRQQYQKSIINSTIQDEQFAYLLGDKLDTVYLIADRIEFKKMDIHFEEVFRIASEHNTDVQNSYAQLENARRSHSVTQKSNLPLPKLTLDFGAYSEKFDKNGHTSGFANSRGNKNIDLIAAINLKWNLLGEGGLFNSRKTDQYHLKKQISEKRYLKQKKFLESKLRQIYKSILNLENQLEILGLQLKNAQKTFDTVFENYVNKKAAFTEYEHALNNLTVSDRNKEIALFEHFLKKISLATTMGVSNLPGKRFEELAKEDL